MGTFAILAAIDKEIAQLQQARNLLSGTERRGAARGGMGNELVVRKKRVLSPEARKRIADAQKKRWAAQKKAAK